MKTTRYLTTSELSAIVPVSRARTGDVHRFRGALQRVRGDDEHVRLFLEPGVERARIYEFRVADIVAARSVTRVSDERGESVAIVEIDVVIGSAALELRPFVVRHGSQDA